MRKEQQEADRRKTRRPVKASIPTPDWQWDLVMATCAAGVLNWQVSVHPRAVLRCTRPVGTRRDARHLGHPGTTEFESKDLQAKKIWSNSCCAPLSTIPTNRAALPGLHCSSRCCGKLRWVSTSQSATQCHCRCSPLFSRRLFPAF